MISTIIPFNSKAEHKVLNLRNTNIYSTQPINDVPDPFLNDNLSVDFGSTLVGKPGDKVTLNCSINGLFRSRIIDIKADIKGNNNFYIIGSDRIQRSFSYFDRNTSYNFDIQISDTAENGTYPIDVTVRYQNPDGTVASTTSTAYLRIEGAAGQGASLKINRADILPNNNVTPGGAVSIGFEIENTSSVLVKNITLDIQGLKEAGLSIINGLSTLNIEPMEPGKKTYVYYSLQSSPTSKVGTYEIKTTLTYENLSKAEKVSKEESSLFINIGGDPSQASALIIENLKFPTGTLSPNKTFNLDFSLRNQGQSEAKRVKVSAKSEDPSGLVSKSVSETIIEKIAPGESVPLNFQYFTTKAGSTKNYPISIKVEYSDSFTEQDKPNTLEQIVGVFMNNPTSDKTPGGAEAKKSMPKLIIDKYEFSPKLPIAGQEFDMSLSFYNTNKSKTVKNIKIFLTSENNVDPKTPTAGSSVFTPVNSSNTFYIDRVPPNGKVSKNIKMFIIPDATAKTYQITANFEYEDEQNTEYKATENIGVPVYQESRLDIDEPTYEKNGVEGMDLPVSVNFYNVGKVTLYNFKVSLVCEDATIANPTYFIGNFAAGGSDTFETSLVPNKSGDVKAKLIFSYEDSTGKQQEKTEELNINVSAQEPMPETVPGENPDMPGATGEAPQKPFYKRLRFIIPVSLLLLGGIFFLVRHFIKKKKEKDLTIDED